MIDIIDIYHIRREGGEGSYLQHLTFKLLCGPLLGITIACDREEHKTNAVYMALHFAQNTKALTFSLCQFWKIYEKKYLEPARPRSAT